MNHQYIEIEAKFKVSDINFLTSWLNKYAQFTVSKDTVDTYYVPCHRNFLEVEYPYEWLRLRNEDGKYSINYKHWYPENSAKSTHCDEFESNLESEEALKKIFIALDFKEVAVVRKHRTKYKVGVFEFCLDKVDGLGNFLEIEYKGKKNNIKRVNQKFEEYQKDLSSALGERNYRGYPYLIIEKEKGLKT